MTRKRSSPMGLEIYLSAMLALVMLPLLAQAAPLQDYTEIQQYTEGCYYNYNHYNEDDRIITNEPCLNCTCHNKMLMCYLRVCPFTKPIGHDCIVEKREDQCCPIITCPEVPVDISHAVPEPGTELSIPEKFGCSIEGKFYLEGAQVPSNPNKPCELCYCIKNRTSCLMQECTLHIDGCTPIYNKGSCCPVRYNCDHENDILGLEDMSTTTELSTTTTTSTTTTERPTTGFILTSTMSPSVSTECIHNGELYADGARIDSETACDNCYCMRGDIICAVQECKVPMQASNGKQCHALPPAEGECCPSNYACEDDSGTTEMYEATTVPHIGLDDETKVTTSAPVKDLHGAIPEEDVQLQTHIDDEEDIVTESSDEVKPTEAPSAEEVDDKDSEKETEIEEEEDEGGKSGTKTTDRIETSTSRKEDAIVTDASTDAVTVTSPPEEHESVTDSNNGEETSEYATKTPSNATEEDDAKEAETTSGTTAALDDKIQELSTETSSDVADEDITKAPLVDKLPETFPSSVADTDIDEDTTKSSTSQEPTETDEVSTNEPTEKKPSDMSTESGEVLITKATSAEPLPDISTEKIDEQSSKTPSTFSGDELSTVDPYEHEVSTKSTEEGKPTTEDSIAKAPMVGGVNQATESFEKTGISTESEEKVVSQPGVHDLVTNVAAEDEASTEDVVTKASLAHDEISDTSGGEEKTTKSPQIDSGEQELEELTTGIPLESAEKEQLETTEASRDAASEESVELSTKTSSIEHDKPSEFKPVSDEEGDMTTEFPLDGEENYPVTSASTVKTGEITTKLPEMTAYDDSSTAGLNKDEQSTPVITTDSSEEFKPTITEVEISTQVSAVQNTERPEISTESSASTEKEMATKAPKIGEEKPSILTSKAPLEVTTDVSEEDQAVVTDTKEAYDEGETADEEHIYATTVVPSRAKPEDIEGELSTESPSDSDEFGSGDSAPDTTEDDDTSKPSTIGSSTEGDSTEEEDDITAKPTATADKETTDEALESVTTPKAAIPIEVVEDKTQIDVTTFEPSISENTTAVAEETSEDITTIKSDVPVEDGTTTSKIDTEHTATTVTDVGYEDKFDFTTVASSALEIEGIKSEVSEADKKKIPESLDITTQVSVSVPSSTFVATNKDISDEEGTTKSDSSEEPVESDEITTQKSIAEQPEPTTVSSIIEIVTQAESDEQKVIPEMDDHKVEKISEEHVGSTDMPVVIVEDMSVVTTPTSSSEDVESERETSKEAVTTPSDEKLPSLDVKVGFGEETSATTVKTIVEGSFVEEMPDMQLPDIIPGEGDCLVGQKTYENNTIVPTSDECEITCRCVSSIVACERVKCEVPEKVEKCVLDQASSNKCCPSYICGIDSFPAKSEVHDEFTEEDKEDELEFTTVLTPHKQTAGSTIKPGSTSEASVTIGSVPEIEIPIASTEEPVSHSKDTEGEGYEYGTKLPGEFVADDKKDVFLDSEVSTTQASVSEDVIIPESMAPIESGTKGPSQTEKPNDLDVPAAQHELTTVVAFKEPLDEDKQLSATTALPSMDEYQTVKPIEHEPEVKDSAEEMMSPTIQSIIDQDDIPITTAAEEEKYLAEGPEDQTPIVHVEVEKEIIESHTVTPTPEIENQESSEEPEVHTSVPTVDSTEEDKEITETQTYAPNVPSEDGQEGSGEIYTQTAAPIGTEEEQTIGPSSEDAASSTMEPSEEEKDDEPEDSTEITVVPEQTYEEGTESHTESSSVEPTDKKVSSTVVSLRDDEDKDTTAENAQSTTTAPSIIESIDSVSTVPSADTEKHSGENVDEIESLEHTITPILDESTSTIASISVEAQKEGHTSPSSDKPDINISTTPAEDTEEQTTDASSSDEGRTVSAKPIEEEKEPAVQKIDISTTGPLAVETSTYESSDEVSGPTVSPVDIDKSTGITDETIASTAVPITLSQYDKHHETYTSVPKVDEVKQESQTTVAPSSDEKTTQGTTSPVTGTTNEPSKITTDIPIDFNVKIDTSVDNFSSSIDEHQTIKPIKDEEIESAAEDTADRTVATSAEEMASTEDGTADHTVVPSAEEYLEGQSPSISVEKEDEDEQNAATPTDLVAEVTTSADDDIRKDGILKDTTVPSAEDESAVTTYASIEKLTEASEVETATEPSAEQDREDRKPFITVPPIKEDKLELEPSMSHIVTSDDSVTTSPVSFEEAAEKSTYKNEIAETIAPDEDIVTVTVPEKKIPVEESSTDGSVEIGEEHTTLATEQTKPPLNLSEQVSEESLESEEEIKPTTPQHVGAFVTERVEEITSRPSVQPAADDTEVEEEGSGEEESIVTDEPEGVQKEEDIEVGTTASAEVPETSNEEATEISTPSKLPEESDEADITEVPATPEDKKIPITHQVSDVTNVPLAADDIDISTTHQSEEETSASAQFDEDSSTVTEVSGVSEEENVAVTIKAPLAAEDLSEEFTKSPVTIDVSTSKQDDETTSGETKAPEMVQAVESITAQQPEETEDTDITEATEAAEGIVPDIISNPEYVEGVDTATAEVLVEDVSAITMAPEYNVSEDNVSAITTVPESVEGFGTSTTQETDDVSAITKVPEYVKDPETSSAQLPEDNFSDITKAPESVEGVESSTVQELDVSDITMVSESDEFVETSTAQESEEHVSVATKAPESVETSTAQESEEDISTVTRTPEFDIPEEVSAPTKTPEIAESSTIQEYSTISYVTKAPESVESVETFTAAEHVEDVPAVTKSPEIVDGVVIPNAKEPNEAVSVVTKAPESDEDIESVTLQEAQKDASDVKKAPELGETSSPQGSMEGDNTVTNAPESDSTTSEAPKDEVSAHAKQPVDVETADTKGTEDVETVTAEKSDEDLSAITQGPETVEHTQTTSISEEEVTDVTSPPEVERTDTASVQESEDVSAVTITPESDEGSESGTPQRPVEDVYSVTKVPETSERVETVPTKDTAKDVSDVTKAPEIIADDESATTQESEGGVPVATKSPESDSGIETVTSQEPDKNASGVTKTLPTADEEVVTNVPMASEPSVEKVQSEEGTQSPESSDKEIGVTTSKMPIHQTDEIEEADVTKTPSLTMEQDKSEEESTTAPSVGERIETTSAKLPETAEHVTEQEEEVTELPVVAHEASTGGPVQTPESDSHEEEEISSDETRTDSAEASDDKLQSTTTIHPLFTQSVTTLPSVVIDGRIDDTNATDSYQPTIQPTMEDSEEDEQELRTPSKTSSSTTTTSAPITTSAPAPGSHYPPQPQPPIYGQQPQYPPQYEDEYTDEDEAEIFGPGTCRYGGKLYVSAQQIPRDDPCDFCFCFRSDIICLQQSCPPPIAGCHEEPISGFCCPRYECPVSMATVLNITTSTTTTSTTLPPHFLHHSYGNSAQRNGCLINGRSYRVGEKIESTSGPCINCTCGGDGKMKCDPQACVPEPTMQQVMAVVAAGRKR